MKSTGKGKFLLPRGHNILIILCQKFWIMISLFWSVTESISQLHPKMWIYYCPWSITYQVIFNIRKIDCCVLFSKHSATTLWWLPCSWRGLCPCRRPSGCGWRLRGCSWWRGEAWAESIREKIYPRKWRSSHIKQPCWMLTIPTPPKPQ